MDAAAAFARERKRGGIQHNPEARTSPPAKARKHTFEADSSIPTMVTPQYFRRLYRTYASELTTLMPALVAFCNQSVGRICFSDQLEVEMSYMRVREARPQIVFEISPAYGYSSLILLHALKRNGVGRLYSFDKQDKATRWLPREFVGDAFLYNFTVGDVRTTLSGALQSIGPPNYAFLDSFHSREFGTFFQRELLSRMAAGAFVSWHDVYNAGMYTDNKPGRDLDAHPTWQPTEEGLSVMQWLAFSGRGTRAFSLSSSARMPAHEWACQARFAAGLSKRLAVRKSLQGSATSVPSGGCTAPYDNPTLFFELRDAQ